MSEIRLFPSEVPSIRGLSNANNGCNCWIWFEVRFFNDDDDDGSITLLVVCDCDVSATGTHIGFGGTYNEALRANDLRLSPDRCVRLLNILLWCLLISHLIKNSM